MFKSILKRVVLSLTVLSALITGVVPNSVNDVDAMTPAPCAVTLASVQQNIGTDPSFAPCSCLFHNRRVISAQAALVFSSSTASSAMGQIHRGTSVYQVGWTSTRFQVRVTHGTQAQHNGWLGRTVWVNHITVACCLG